MRRLSSSSFARSKGASSSAARRVTRNAFSAAVAGRGNDRSVSARALSLSRASACAALARSKRRISVSLRCRTDVNPSRSMRASAFWRATSTPSLWPWRRHAACTRWAKRKCRSLSAVAARASSLLPSSVPGLSCEPPNAGTPLEDNSGPSHRALSSALASAAAARLRRSVSAESSSSSPSRSGGSGGAGCSASAFPATSTARTSPSASGSPTGATPSSAWEESSSVTTAGRGSLLPFSFFPYPPRASEKSSSSSSSTAPSTCASQVSVTACTAPPAQQKTRSRHPGSKAADTKGASSFAAAAARLRGALPATQSAERVATSRTRSMASRGGKAPSSSSSTGGVKAIAVASSSSSSSSSRYPYASPRAESPRRVLSVARDRKGVSTRAHPGEGS
mmetsp:Transcript_11767/g.50416  ORF Transcript_11767/g.50416 Transcript_11767/m.50416 type:complete len:394 (+) Transcript_11767:250-1431(+)